MPLHMTRRTAICGLAGSLSAIAGRPARAADKLRVGKAVAEVFGYVPLDVGLKAGIFEKNGLEIEEINFAGGAKMAQAVVAGAVDISLSSGPEMVLVAKGVPEIAVASITHSPAFMAIVVGPQFTGNGADALKGKKIGITTAGSLTQWIVDALNKTKGWTGDERAVAVPIGGSPTAVFAALKVGQIDADVGGPPTGFELEERHEGRLLIACSAYLDAIELFTIFASNRVIETNPDAVRRFLKGWYESVAFMKAHKAESVDVAAAATGFSVNAVSRTYDSVVSGFSTDGKFEPDAIATLRASFVDLKLLPDPIDMTKLYTERFLPKGSST